MSEIVESSPKKLRSSEPDLQIILGSGDDVSIQWHHSSILAAKSKYIDTMLSTQMREQASRKITFPDITPEIWEKMNSFLDDPLASRNMKPEDVRDVALLYDKYEFTMGRKLCEAIISDYLNHNSLKEKERSYTLDLELIIHLTSVAQEAHFSSAFEMGREYLLGKLTASVYRRNDPYGRIMFTEEQVKQIFSMIKDTPQPNHHIENLKYFLDGGDKSFEKIVNYPGIENEYVLRCKDIQNCYFLWCAISHLEITGADCANGVYEREMWCDSWYTGSERTSMWGGRRVKFQIQFTSRGDENGWAIVRFEEPANDEDDPVYEICWWAPYSRNMSLPPAKGWVPHDPLARGNSNPSIEYILREHFLH